MSDYHPHSSPRRRWRTTVLTAAVALTASTGVIAAPAGPAYAQADCVDVDIVTTTYPSGPASGLFQLTITLTNECAYALPSWTLQLGFPPGSALLSGWNADWAWQGQTATASSPGWAGGLAPGQSTSIGAMGTYSGEFTGPTSCAFNGSPCDGESSAAGPPTVTLTSPADGATVIYPCPVLLSADATAPGGEVDRVEFYIDDVLVGSVSEAPYDLRVPSSPPYTHTAFARVYDTADPPGVADSDLATFQLLVPPPALMIIACARELDVPEGDSATVEFYLSANTTVPVDLTVTGTGASAITVEPDSFDLDGSVGEEVVVKAAPGSGGATATISASAPGFMSTSVSVSVVASP